MKNKLTSILILGVVGATAMSARATDATDSIRSLPRPVTQTYSLEIGTHWSRSTYLSPLTYRGLDLAIAGEWQKAMPFAPERAMMDFYGRAAIYPNMLNPGGSAQMQGFEIEFFWGMGAYWKLPYSLTVGICGGPEFEGGTLLLLRNSNNPVGVNLSASLAARAAISWNGKLGKLPVTASWTLRTPMIGAFFMPDYGETFYEIYVGNHSNLVHVGFPGNHFRLNSLIGVQLDFGRTAMEVGYRILTDSFRANNLKTHQLSHSFSIGVIPHGLGRKKKVDEIRPFF